MRPLSIAATQTGASVETTKTPENGESWVQSQVLFRKYSSPVHNYSMKLAWIVIITDIFYDININKNTIHLSFPTDASKQ